MKNHQYEILINWTGNLGEGTKGYRRYNRDHIISDSKKLHEILGTSDPSFQGDSTRYNPEELFISSLSSCHMLWYLHLCSTNKIIVQKYSDKVKGIMVEDKNGSGHFSEVILNPQIVIDKENNINRAIKLHEEAHKMCFIANSCNFDILIKPQISTKEK